ncbi:MAG: glycosyltransferase [Schleiferiaceae bacterium]
MLNKVLVLDRMLGGLESDISDHYSDVNFSLIPHRPGRLFVLYWLLNNLKYAKEFTIVSCGGKWQLLWALILLRNCRIYFPGVPDNWHLILKLLNRINAGVSMMTCDLKTAEKTSAVYYSNYNKIVVKSNETANRSIDIFLVGRNDKNKRFEEFVNSVLKVLPGLRIVHAGLPRLANKYVSAHGQLASNKLEESYLKSKIVCLPSLYESSPRVVQEALEKGCIVITTHVGNLRYMYLHRPINTLEELVGYVIEVLGLSDKERAAIYVEQLKQFNSFAK